VSLCVYACMVYQYLYHKNKCYEYIITFFQFSSLNDTRLCKIIISNLIVLSAISYKQDGCEPKKNIDVRPAHCMRHVSQYNWD